MSGEARKAALTQEEAGLSSDTAALQKQLEVKLGAPCSHAEALGSDEDAIYLVSPYLQRQLGTLAGATAPDHRSEGAHREDSQPQEACC